MGLKIGSQLLGRHVYSIAHLLVMRVVLLGRREYFTDVVHWALNRLRLVLLRMLYHHHYTDHPIGCRNVQHHWLLLNRGSQNRCRGEHALQLSECIVCLGGPSELLHQLIQRNFFLSQPTKESTE